MRQTVLLLGVVAMACSAGCVTSRTALQPGRVEVIAHRGASAYAPENTLAAFKLAHEQKADWFELDCTLTQDGEVVVIHDGSIDRTTTGEGEVCDLTFDEIRQYDAGSWKAPEFSAERVPSLAETLNFAKGRIGVYIEIKNSADDSALAEQILELAKDSQTLTPEMETEVMAAIEASGTRNLELTRKVIALVRDRYMEDEIVIQSFSSICCAVAAIEAPEMRVEFLTGAEKDNPGGWESALRWTYLLGLEGFNPTKKGIDPGRLAVCHAGGKSVAVWTVDATPEMRRLAEWGVDRIITNRPDACLEVLKEAGKR